MKEKSQRKSKVRKNMAASSLGAADSSKIEVKGCSNFRLNLTLATLSGRTLLISNIRSGSETPGLAPFEVDFLKLLEKVTNGSKISINHTGTRVLYVPGQITGGTWDHSCDIGRTIGWYLEPLILMAPFSKQAMRITLNGVTHSNELVATSSSSNPENIGDGKSRSADYGLEGLASVLLPLMENFGIDSTLIELIIKQRCYSPNNLRLEQPSDFIPNGKVFFTCPIVSQLKPIRLVDLGRIRKIRGIAHSMNLGSAFANRMIDGVRQVVNRFIPDIFITTDVQKGGRPMGAPKSAVSTGPGYGLFLTATSTTGQRLGVQAMAPAQSVPENFASDVATRLLFEIEQSGYVDTSLCHFLLIWMALTPADVSQIRLGPLSPKAVTVLRQIKLFLNVVFKIDPIAQDDDEEFNGFDDEAEEKEKTEDSSSQGVMLTVVGSDYWNNNRKHN